MSSIFPSGPSSLRGLDSGPPSLMSDNEFGPPSLTGVKFAYSTLENALPAIVDEVDDDDDEGVFLKNALVEECTKGLTFIEIKRMC